jgi:hypothetical protein
MVEKSELSRRIQAVARDEAAVRSAARYALASFDGYLDRADGDRIEGWVWDTLQVVKDVQVEIYDGGVFLTSVVANSLRPDLKRQGVGTGRYGFSLPTPAGLKDGAEHLIEALVAFTEFRLKGCPCKLRVSE